VSDGGQQALDPLQPAAPTVPVTPVAPAQPAAPQPTAPTQGFPAPAAPLPPTQPAVGVPVAGPPGAGGPVTTPKQKGKGVLIAAAVVAAIVVVGAVVLVLSSGGDDGGSGTFGVSEDTLDSDTAYVTRSFTLDQGEAIRIRVEPDRGLDTAPGVVVDQDTAEAIAEVLGEEFQDQFSDGADTDEILDEVFTDSDVFSDSDAASDLEDLLVYQTFDIGAEGEPDADWVVAPVDGTYQLVVTSYEGDGDVRIVTEKYDEVLSIDSELFSDDGPFSERFFTDEDFYSDDRSYDPEG
jgi:hypothetical protein